MRKSTESLFFVPLAAVVAVAGCSGDNGASAPPLHANPRFPEASVVLEDSAVSTVAHDGAVAHATCAIELGGPLPDCAAEVEGRHVCDGTVSACAIPAGVDGGEAAVFVCQNMNDGIALEWAKVTPVPGDCAARPVAACTASGRNEVERTGQEISAILGACAGNESFVDVWLTGGCVTHLVSGTSRPEQEACLVQRLGASRFDCAHDVPCSGALLSTLR